MSRTTPRPSTDKTVAKNRTRLLFLLGGAVVAAVVLAILLTPPRQSDGVAEHQTVTISGETLASFAGDPSSDPARGLSAPQLSGFDFEGSTVTIPADGRPKVILFLAHWCPHCQNEVQSIVTYLRNNDFPAGADLYSVATASSSTRPNWPPSAWLEREGWPFPVIVDDEQSSAFEAFGRGAFPFYVFVDANGTVVLRLSGEQDPVHLAELMQELPAA
jgi:thiol-disulfide isomerase/thioredoxin